MKHVLMLVITAVLVSGSVYSQDKKKDNTNPIAIANANQNGIDNSNVNSALKGSGTDKAKQKAEKLAQKKADAEKIAKAKKEKVKNPVLTQVETVYCHLTLTNYVTVTQIVTNTVTVTEIDNHNDAIKASQKKFFNLNSLPNDYYIGGKPRHFIADSQFIYLSLSETSREVVKLHPDTGAVLARFDVGSQPCGLAYTGGEHIMVALQRESAIVKVNTTTGKVEARVTVPVSPLALAFDGTFLYTGSYEGTSVTKIDPITMTVKGSYQVGFRPADITCDGNSIWVANYGSNTVTKLHKDGRVLGTHNTGFVQPYGISFEMGTENVWITHFNNGGIGTVVKMSPTGEILKSINLGKGAAGICSDGNGGMLVTCQSSAEVYRINTTTGELESVKTSAAPWGVIHDGVNTWIASQLGGCINKR